MLPRMSRLDSITPGRGPEVKVVARDRTLEKIVNANVFKQRLDELMESALTADDGAPLGMMIVRLEVEKQKCLTIQLQIEAAQRQRETASKIVPANGKLPPFSKQ